MTDQAVINFVKQIARMTCDGEIVPGASAPFVMENDDAVDTLNALIDKARELTK